MRKKSLEGWTNKMWINNFYWNLQTNPLITKQNVAKLMIPYITNPCTKYIDKRSHIKIKVRITIEEL